MSKKTVILIGILSILLGKYFLGTTSFWFKDFFQQIETLNPTKAVFFQIWVCPSLEPQPDVFIGGTLDRQKQWIIAVESFLNAAQRYDKNSLLTYKILCDRKTYEAQKSLFQQWQSRYFERFDYQVLEDYYPLIDSSITAIMRPHCEHGCAALCSDWLRLEYLFEQQVPLMIYMDIDTFSQAVQHRASSSKNLLGAHIQHPGWYHTFFSSAHKMSFNSDLLVKYQAHPHLNLILKNKAHRIVKESELIYQMMQRAEKNAIEQNNFDDLKDWMKSHPNLNINPMAQILFGIGPSFYLDWSYQGIIFPYRGGYVQQLKNYMSWQKQKNYPQLPTSYERLSFYYDETVALSWAKLYWNLYYKSMPLSLDSAALLNQEIENLKKDLLNHSDVHRWHPLERQLFSLR